MKNVRLYRSQSDRMIGGVCGGLGTYLNIDPLFIRLVFVLLLFGSDFGFLFYLLLWILIPEEGKAYGFKDESFSERVKSMGGDLQQAVSEPHPQSGILLGIGLIVVGALLFINRLDIPWLHWFDLDLLWPVLLIVGGIVLLVRREEE